jgi:hypothetical protein
MDPLIQNLDQPKQRVNPPTKPTTRARVGRRPHALRAPDRGDRLHEPTLREMEVARARLRAQRPSRRASIDPVHRTPPRDSAIFRSWSVILLYCQLF